ncbi:MAG TPA: glycosyltransferase [Terriglobia bacterium]|nr:glycosyltransferase [Terriglobia bacterium]
MKVLHLDAGPDWRGGQQQVLYLAQGLKATPVNQQLVVRAGGKLATRLQATELSSSCLPFRSEWDPVSLFRLFQILRNFRPEIVHAHDARTLGLAVILKGIGGKFRLVASRRVAFPIRRNPLWKMKYQQSPARIVAVSQFIRESLIKDGINPAKITVIYDGIELPSLPGPESRFSARRIVGVAEQEFLIGNIGHLTREKGHEVLVRGFKQVLVREPKAKLLIVGDGPLRDLLRRLVKELGLETNVLLPGPIADLGSILPAMDLFVYPSLEEGLGSVLLMAMAYRVPVCASQTGGIPELVIDGITGRLFAPGDPGALAVVVASSLAMPAQMQEYADKAFTRVTQQFQVQRMVSATFDLYARLLNQ